MKKFSISEAVKFGWNIFKAHYGLLIGVVLISFGVSAISNLSQNDEGIFGFLVMIAATVVGIIIQIGYTKITLKLHDGEHAEIGEIFNYRSLFWKYLGVSILYGLIVFVGFILLVIPGIYLALKYSFAPLVVVDKGKGPVEALKESGRLTKDTKLNLLLFWLAALGINIVGVIVLGIGLLVTVPVTMLACVFVYRKLLDTPAIEVPIAEPSPIASNPETTITA